MVWSLCVSLHGSQDYVQSEKIYHTDHMHKEFLQCVAACVLLDLLGITMVTFVPRFRPGVQLAVFLEVLLSSETFTTFQAQIWLFSCVYQQMFL